jgi:hypothetical protein
MFTMDVCYIGLVKCLRGHMYLMYVNMCIHIFG